VDIDPTKAGRNLGSVVDLEKRIRLRVTDDPVAAIRLTRPDVAVLCTSSSLRKVWPQIRTILERRVPIVSTTEELSYPYLANRSLARKIDAAAKKAKVAVVGTGVNPGFAMDTLPIALTAVCERVDTVRVARVQDARARRLPFQRKIGAGLTVEEFGEGVRAGTIRHVGLAESVAMIADALGWKLDRVTDEIQPMIAKAPIHGELLSVDAGLVCGITQDGVGYREGRPAIVLHMEAYLGAPETYDSVQIQGSPPLHVKAAGGYHGDIATTAITVNTIPRVLRAAPGLQTMRSLALPSYAGGR
jgi:4-hydroxy-tetrahydrodipicolinate reductase